MADDTAWQPPGEGDTEAGDTVDAATDGAPTDRPTLPTLPTLPAAAPSLPAPPPVPPSAWAPGSESTIVSPPLPPSGPTTPPPVTPPSGFDSAATIVAEPLVSNGRRSGWLVGSAVVAVLAVVAAGVFAIVNLRTATAGGSVNPADLGSELLAAIESEDVLGVIDVLAPGERQALGEPFVELVSQLQRLDVLAETDLSAIAGLDIELTNEIVRTRTTNVDDIVNISMSADVVISIDGAELPIGDLLSDNMPDDMLTELRGTRVTQNEEFDISLTAVSVDGRWYFSLLHTIAEAARSDFGDEIGIPFQGVGFDGAESPEAAVDQIIDRIEALDLTGIIRSLDPDEAAALQRYAPLFLEDAEAALADAPIDWRITDRSVRFEGSGDERTAFLDALGVEGTIDGSPFSFSFEGECFSAELDGERIEQCAEVGTISDVEDLFGDNPEVLRLIEVVQEAFADVEPVGLELRQRDGEWFVSPIASITDAMLGMLRALDRDELDQIIEAAEPAFESIVDDFFGVDDDFFGSDDFAIATDSPLIAPDITDGVDEDLGWIECYEFDAAEATACFRSFEASGVIGVADIPVVLRHPECGYEVSWGGANYQLPDDEFIALAEASRSCFLDLVESGQVDTWELPDEILVLECFEGRNWYQVFDDPEYDLRFDACRSEQLGF